MTLTLIWAAIHSGKHFLYVNNLNIPPVVFILFSYLLKSYIVRNHSATYSGDMKRISIFNTANLSLLVFGQDEDSVSALPLQNSIDSPAYKNAPQGGNTGAPLGSSKLGFMTSVEFQLSMAVLIFGLVIIGLEIFQMTTRTLSWTASPHSAASLSKQMNQCA